MPKKGKKTEGKPGYCDTEPNSTACKNRQKGQCGRKCRLDCKFAKK